MDKGWKGVEDFSAAFAKKKIGQLEVVAAVPCVEPSEFFLRWVG
jgi:hypothetical protein